MSADLVPADNMAALDAMDPATREVAVTRMLDEARGWLAHAVESTGPQTIASFKAQMATVAEATKQLGLSKEIQLDAAEMVRRSERGLGVAIRKGQEAGEIETIEDARSRAGLTAQGHHVVDNDLMKQPVGRFANHDELSGNGAGIYHLTDNVTDEQFDAAIDEAKAEGNLSRANVVRKVKGEKPGASGGRHDLLRKTRRIDSHRVINEAVAGAGLPPESVFDEVDFTSLDAARLQEWVSSLTNHIAALRSLRSRLTKELDRRG